MSTYNITNILFSKVFNNTVIRNEIFNRVYSINKKLLTINNTSVFGYNRLILSPKALIGNDYLDLFIQYLNVHDFDKNKISHYFMWSVDFRNLRILQYLYALISESIDEEIITSLKPCNLMSLAAYKCNVDMLEWMNQNNDLEIFKSSSKYLMLPGRPNAAASSANLDILTWVLENYDGCKDINWLAVITSVVINEHVNILEWINEHHRPSDIQLTYFDLLHSVSANIHCDTIDWIHKNWRSVNFDHNYDSVAMSGSLELIRWLYENLSATNTKPVFTMDAIDNSAYFNSAEVTDFLHYNLWKKGQSQDSPPD
ncbi:hypothetical protein PPL_05518 [Heterostelium album PN500]|uniref:Ankyrin repeat protein n=1 Tax=Heterostelium pallidum (strain ATCC 26659 / Pp 5 / PN500) TaxID=670386 RepID=D3BAE2_HETP5|nr:hypothetical protein PPL_05518 [Heterostelium album PN500]EFA81529.1 hypothetical protein PPL_05518 [Heterostelium album PN500]|eukprot:XP_020433646.1 hypothetical protein PPL_05518 [Heterostelium album PN500]